MTGTTPLDCRETLARLDDYVDRELAGEELARVREHLQRCALCAREFTFEERVLRATRARLARIEAPAEVKARVLEALRRGPR